jgi:hypothetical protein
VQVTRDWEPPPAARSAPEITNASQRAVAAKLDSIRLTRLAFDRTPLREVVRMLSEESRRLDPEGKGINFLISASHEEVGRMGGAWMASEVIDPVTGQILPGTRVHPNRDFQEIPVTINPPLIDISLRDAMDAIVTVAERPVDWSLKDYGVMFGPKRPWDSDLHTRLFIVDPATLYEFLQSSGALRSESRTEPNYVHEFSAAVAKHFASLGVDLNPARGRSIFFNDRQGTMLVRANPAELDVIETSIQSLNHSPPQVNIQVRFYELSEAGEQRLRTQWAMQSPETNLWTGILTDPQFRLTLRALNEREGAALLDQLQVTTLSGREAQLQSTELVTVITGINPDALQPPGLTSTETNSLYQTQLLPFGTSVDLNPVVEADGKTIRMRLTPSVTEFLGYDNQGQTNRTLVYINGVREWVPIPLPSWTSRNTSTSAVVQDGQTLVLGSLPGTDLRRNGKPGDKRMLVFITPTIIDAAGNRVNTR